MTEQERYDQLNIAIDALLTGGRAGPTGDSELDALARVATGLRHLPDPDFRGRLGAELVPERADGRVTSVRDWIERVMRRPFVVAPLAFAAGAAAVTIAVLIVTSVIGPGGAEREAFGTLPPPARGGGQGGGGEAIPPPPGALGTITYALPPDLSLPTAATVYRLRRLEVTADRVQEIAQRLGIDGNVEPLTGDDGTLYAYRVGSSAQVCDPRPPEEAGLPEGDEKRCRPLQQFQMTLGGEVFFDAPPAAGAAPSQEQAQAAAQRWLDLTGLTGEDPIAFTVGEPLGRTDGLVTATLRTTASPVEGLDYPRLDMRVAASGQVYSVYGSWASIDAEASYPLRSPDELLSDLTTLAGDFSLFYPRRLGSDNLFADDTKDASAAVDSVELAYARGAAGDGTPYLVPVYVVHGRLVQGAQAEAGPTPSPLPPADLEAIYRQLNDALNRDDLASALSFYSDDVEVYGVAGIFCGPEPCLGKEELQRAAQAFGQTRTTIQDVVVSGNVLTAQTQIESAMYGGLLATSILTFEGAKIVREDINPGDRPYVTSGTASYFTIWLPATDTASPPSRGPELPPELAELVAVRDALPVPPGETFRDSFWGDPGIITAYFVENRPEAVAEFYRRELLAQGWQAEQPATLLTTAALTYAVENAVTSFTKWDLRVAIVVSPNEKDPARGATFLHVVVEQR